MMTRADAIWSAALNIAIFSPSSVRIIINPLIDRLFDLGTLMAARVEKGGYFAGGVVTFSGADAIGKSQRTRFSQAFRFSIGKVGVFTSMYSL